MHPTEKCQSHVVLEQILSPVQVWRQHYATNYVGRPQSQRREIERGSHGYLFIATLSGTPFLLFLTSPINYSLDIFPCNKLPSITQTSGRTPWLEDQLTEEIHNTQGQRRLSCKADVTATRYNVKLRTMTGTGLNWLRYGPIACFVMTVMKHHITLRAGCILMNCIITKC